MIQSKNESAYQKTTPQLLIRGIVQKPISLMALLVALCLLVLALFSLVTGNLYIERLNYIDSTTLIMVAILIFRALMKLHYATDLETISIALVSSLSFVYFYEAIYKWSFYLLPWKIPAPELREFLLQSAVGLTILTGFAMQVFKLRRKNYILVGIFLVAWIFWLAIGFPQLWDGVNVHNAIFDLALSGKMIYALNRGSKIVWFIFYYCLYA